MWDGHRGLCKWAWMQLSARGGAKWPMGPRRGASALVLRGRRVERTMVSFVNGSVDEAGGEVEWGPAKNEMLVTAAVVDLSVPALLDQVIWQGRWAHSRGCAPERAARTRAHPSMPAARACRRICHYARLGGS